MSEIKRITIFWLICIISVAGNVSCSGETSLPELSYAPELQEAIDQVLLAYSEYHLGVSAAIIVPGFQTWAGASGYSHQGIPITTDMLFDIGSVEKNFEAGLVLKLVEDERLSLDDPIAKYLPSYPNVDGNITIRQLLNHTSGVFNVFEHPDFPWVGPDVDYSKAWTEEEVFNNFVLDSYGPPGYAQHYSSTNYLLITAIIEEVTGTSVPHGIERYFLDPMKLEHTFISMGEPPPAKYAVAHPWVDIDLDGTLDDLYGIPLTWIATLTHPVMFSTPQDQAYWMHALYHEKSVLSPESLVEMLTFPETTLSNPDGGKYGLGVIDFTDILRTHVIGHGGSALGYSAAALYMPEYGISVAWLINTGESPWQLAGQMMGDIWAALSDVIVENQR